MQDDVRSAPPIEAAPVRPESRRLAVAGALVAAVLLLVLAAWLVLRSSPVLSESFDGPDGTWVDMEDTWARDDLGLARNADWFANDGALEVRSGRAHTADRQFRMYTRRTDLADVTVSFDLTWHGYSGGSEDWRGMNIWLNRTVCTPVPDCDAVDDPDGNSGYMLRFFAADGYMIVNKKISGDTRDEFPERATDYVQGGTYYWMDKVAWQPVEGRTYRFEGRVVDNGDGSSTIEMSVDGDSVLRVVDDGTVGGPPLNGGRVGVRGDYADMSIDNLEITR